MSQPISMARADAQAGWPASIFDPAGPYAGSVTALSWILIAMSIAVLALVIFAFWAALFGNPRLKKRLGGTRAIWCSPCY